MSADDAQGLLEQARKAWRVWRSTSSTITRLRGYARMTPAMKDDFRTASARNYEAERTLERILGGKQE